LERTPRFVVYRDFESRYRWRLRSSQGATIALSASGHREKAACEQEMEPWTVDYPDASVRDATAR
jgi:uncharacterized protein YegP (UPF0339 family)